MALQVEALDEIAPRASLLLPRQSFRAYAAEWMDVRRLRWPFGQVKTELQGPALGHGPCLRGCPDFREEISGAKRSIPACAGLDLSAFADSMGLRGSPAAGEREFGALHPHGTLRGGPWASPPTWSSPSGSTFDPGATAAPRRGGPSGRSYPRGQRAASPTGLDAAGPVIG